MPIYENIVIGNYLFELGVRMAKLRPDLPLVSVNLLQQTPSDQLLGDVLLANAAVCRLIEFKRKRNKSDKEVKKLQRLKMGCRNRKILKCGRASHARCIGMSYIDFSDQSEVIDLNEFAARAANEACSEPSEDATKFKMYLEFVTKVNANTEKEQSKVAPKAASGTFAIAITKKGQIRWLAVQDVGQVFMKQRDLEQALGIVRQSDSPRYERKIDRGIGGPGY